VLGGVGVQTGAELGLPRQRALHGSRTAGRRARFAAAHRSFSPTSDAWHGFLNNIVFVRADACCLAAPISGAKFDIL
jgi:hypothetical protein